MERRKEFVRAKRDGKEYIADPEEIDEFESLDKNIKHPRVKRAGCIPAIRRNQYNQGFFYNETSCDGKTNVDFLCEFFGVTMNCI